MKSSKLAKMKVKDVKKVCSTMKVTISTAGKTALIERLVTYSEMGLLESGEYTALRWHGSQSHVLRHGGGARQTQPDAEVSSRARGEMGQRPACAGEVNRTWMCMCTG